MSKVVITDYQYENIDTEKQIFTEAGIEVKDYQYKTADELIPVVKDADAIVTQYSLIDRQIIESLEHCKMIIKYGIGVNNIDVEAATEKNIYVCNVPDYGVEEVSDHVVTMLLNLSKKLTILTKALKEGEWGYSSVVPLKRIKECTMGLIGFGRIPQLVAKKMSGFGLKINAYDPYVSEETAKEKGVELVSLDKIFTDSDFISIHCPQTKETEHLVNAEAFKKMKNTAFLINTARGPIVSEEDLIEALMNKEIAGAGLDVFENEPLGINNPLLQMENVIATPHSAWYSETAIASLQRKVAEEVVNVLQGNQPFNCVNRKQLQE